MAQTIAAIATAQAPAGIGVIRISGEDARAVASAVFRPATGESLPDLPGYTARYGTVFDGAAPIDKAVALVFIAPHSYTGEDVVEISCHGGLYVMQAALRAVLAAGAELAQPGEFTRRAFLNGKMTLTGAEAVMGIISAQGKQAAQAALAAHEGAVFRRIEQLRGQMLTLSAHMAAWVDYPEDDIPALDEAALPASLREIHAALLELLREFDLGRVLREGVDTVIIGRPNVGKSTLMNLLAGSERSIVTEVAGTTRDVVEETVRLGDILLRLADTAGLRSTEDPVERIGVDRARGRLQSADLVLAVFDASEPLSPEDHDLLDALENRPAIAVVNKTDLPQQLDLTAIRQKIRRIVTISAKTGEGRDALTDAVGDLLGVAQLQPAEGMLATERQRDCCRRAADCIAEAIDAAELLTLDAVNVSVDCAIAALLELTGERVTDAVVDEVFSRFCVGK